MLPIIISFFTKDWTYPQHGERLKKECRDLKLQHDIVLRESMGGYIENTRMKPFFIREMLLKHKAPVLWIDVDGSIYQKPVFCTYLETDMALRPKTFVRDGRKWHVGTMWFNYTEATLKFLDEWCELSTKITDEFALHEWWQANGKTTGFTIAELPDSYHEIQGYHSITDKTVIYHRISSGISKRLQRGLWTDNDNPFNPESSRKCQRGRVEIVSIGNKQEPSVS